MMIYSWLSRSTAPQTNAMCHPSGQQDMQSFLFQFLKQRYILHREDIREDIREAPACNSKLPCHLNECSFKWLVSKTHVTSIGVSKTHDTSRCSSSMPATVGWLAMHRPAIVGCLTACITSPATVGCPFTRPAAVIAGRRLETVSCHVI